MTRSKDDIQTMMKNYDDEAEASGWFGPEVAFGLTYAFIRPGQRILDIGIGTGLGSVLFRKAGLKVHGMDFSNEKLEACRSKGFTDLERHDLTKTPYPYETGSMDHAVCVGVLNFFRDLSPVFGEAARIIRKKGLFVFVVGDREGDEPESVQIGEEHTGSSRTVTIHRHSPREIGDWFHRFGMSRLRELAFTIFMDPGRTLPMRARAYLAEKS